MLHVTKIREHEYKIIYIGSTMKEMGTLPLNLRN